MKAKPVMNNSGLKKGLSSALMAMAILGAPFIVPLLESKDTEGEDLTALSMAINIVNESGPRQTYNVSSSTPQFVLFAFDGSKSVKMLEDTLAFEQKMIEENKPIHFTYFVNAAYFLTNDNAGIYRPPHAPAGTSNIGFSDSAEDIVKRVALFNAAAREGNEIASHGTGHWNGLHWSEDDWKKEFDSFKSILNNVAAYNSDVKIDAPDFAKDIEGFRAPDLGINESMYGALRDFGFSYDGSGVGRSDLWPQKDILGIWHIPIPVIKIGNPSKAVLGMDYSIYVQQTEGKDKAKKGSALWDQIYEETKKAYLEYFYANYYGSRAPVIMANHFSLMNDGVYWEVMKDVAGEVCGLPSVRCSTYKAAIKYLNRYGPPAPADRN